LAYIPTRSVEDLAALLKVKTSKFYTGLQATPAELAAHVDASFNVDTVSGPVGGTSDSGSGSGGQSTAASASSSSASQTRQDAIIGVVSALGGITLIVLILLIFRALKRRQELAHRRLSDPPAGGLAGLRPTGQEFDRDSVGGQRRRSFYFAADSLAGAEAERSHADDYARPPAMRQRVGQQAISSPVLRDNTMNW
jgi:hypothetical protein